MATTDILVVEDFEDVRLLYVETLRAAGFIVSAAANGAEAVATAQRERPRLVLMDLSMPEMDGWEASKQIRAIDPAYKVDIIALSAVGGAESKATAFAMGCDGFIEKPCPPDVLLSVMKAFLGEPRQS